ncbi:MAG: beta-lactamase family protein [Acidobacteria bacterium]|nr:beta-lactamase family protein [Acidobacteriota bacterium]
MNQFRAVMLCFALIALGYAQGQTPKPIEPLSTAQLEKIESTVKAWMAQSKAPALSVALVTDDQLRWAKGYGWADVENRVAAQPDTAYRLASIAKTLTAVAVLQLVEQGKLKLDEPIHSYCAAYPAQQKFKDTAYAITLRQLLVHQSGVRHNRFDETNTTKHYATINDAIASFKDDPLVSEPETKYSYSTPGYTLLGCAIETASGLSYFDYLREHILKPAGMTRTFVDDVYALIPQRARGYRNTAGGEIQNAPLHDTSIKCRAAEFVSRPFRLRESAAN